MTPWRLNAAIGMTSLFSFRLNCVFFSRSEWIFVAEIQAAISSTARPEFGLSWRLPRQGHLESMILAELGESRFSIATLNVIYDVPCTLASSAAWTLMISIENLPRLALGFLLVRLGTTSAAFPSLIDRPSAADCAKCLLFTE